MSELSPSNYVRINLINWFLSVPMIVLFAWPYYYAAKLMGINEAMRYIGAFIFSIPFMITIIHGHVTMALGAIHRIHYYKWLNDNPYTYGIFFNKLLISTRFRLILLIVSLLFLPVGYLFSY